MTRTALSLAVLPITAARASALTGPEIVAQAQTRNGFSTWHDRRAVVTLDPDDRLMKTITCEGYFPSGHFMTARSCSVAHVNGTRATITVREVAYDAGVADDLFTIGHLGDGN